MPTELRKQLVKALCEGGNEKSSLVPAQRGPYILNREVKFDPDKENQVPLTKDLNKELINENTLIRHITQKLVSVTSPLAIF